MIPTLISTGTADDEAAIDFTSGIDSTYDHYMFVFINVAPANENRKFMFQVNATDGADYNDSAIRSTNFYAYHHEDDSTPTVNYVTGDDLDLAASFQTIANEMTADADQSLCGVMNLFNPSNTTYIKQFNIVVSFSAVTGQPIQYHTHTAGFINDATAIDDVRFKMSSGNFDGTIQMYGIK